MRDNFMFKSREVDDRSRSGSREREKKDGFSRQYTRSSTLEGAKLHIGHLPPSITEESLKAEFEKFGKVDDVRIVKKDMNGQQLKGYLYAFITMCLAEDAQSAMKKINQDRALGWNVSYSREKVGRDNSRSPQRNPRQKPRFIEDAIDERLSKRPQQNYLASENESQDLPQNLNLDIDNICAIEAKEAPKESSDNPDDFISYNNHDGDDFLGDNHSMTNENYNGFNDQDTAETEESTAYSNNLLSLLCSNENEHQPKPKEVAKPVHAHSEKSNQLTSSLEKKILNGNSILVRELWLGNLTQNISEGELRDIVSQFGEVENIEDYIKPTTRFAFVKFKTINQASKANEAIGQLKNQLNSPNLKIAFSDHQRRKNVIGNAIDYEIDEDLTPIVYIGFSTGATITAENNIREMFSRFRGEVLNIGINQMPKQHSAKSYALVEMGSREQAKAVRQRLYFDDMRRENRIRLGDKNCELCILSKPRAREPFCAPNHGPNQGMHRHFQPNFQHQPMMHPHHRMNGPYGPQNGHYNGPRDHLGNPINFQNHPRNHFQDHPHHFMGHEHMDGPHPNINRFGHPGGMEMMNHGFPMDHMGNPHFHNPQFNPNFMNHPNCGPNGPNGPNFGPHPFHGGFNPNMHINPNFNPNMYNNNHHNFEEIKRQPTMDFSDLPASTAASSNSKSPKEKGFSETTETNSEATWSGFIVKSKQNRIGVDAVLLQGEDSLLKNIFNLNISHRVMFDELPEKPLKAMLTFIPSDNNHSEQFNGLVKYFIERNRAGFVALDNHTLYLLPPCEKSSEFHQIGNNELLGLIFDSKDSLPSMNKFRRMASEIKYDQDEDSDINEALSILRNSDFGNLLL